MSAAVDGTRACTLFKVAARLGEFVGGGLLNEHEVRDALTHAAESAGLQRREIDHTIRNGIKRGRNSPDYGPA